MSIYSLRPDNSIYHKIANVLVYFFALIGAGLLVYFLGDLLNNYLKNLNKSNLKVDAVFGSAQVFVNGSSLGNTPFETSTIQAGDNKITLKNDSNQYDVDINFFPQSQVVVTRDLGISEVFSSGKNFWLEKSDSDTVLSVISNISGALIFIDGTEVGKTPYSTSTLTEGEYDLRVEAPFYEGHSERIKIKKGFKLNSSFTLFPLPSPLQIKLLSGSDYIYDFSTSNDLVTANPLHWVKAIIYWSETRGLNFEKEGLVKKSVIDLYLDYRGNLYDSSGNQIAIEDIEKVEKSKIKLAYLGKSSDNGLSEAAKKVVITLEGGAIAGITKVKVKPTSTGWLRVRADKNINATEIAKIDVGGTYDLLEQDKDWVKIKVSNEVSGWVSATYLEIPTNSSSSTVNN